MPFYKKKKKTNKQTNKEPLIGRAGIQRMELRFTLHIKHFTCNMDLLRNAFLGLLK